MSKRCKGTFLIALLNWRYPVMVNNIDHYHPWSRNHNSCLNTIADISYADKSSTLRLPEKMPIYILDYTCYLGFTINSLICPKKVGRISAYIRETVLL